MKRIFAIACVSIQSAVRSRVVLTLMATMLAIVFILPLTIQGDGTMSGYVRILLSYTLGFLMVVLSITSLWAGCAAISNEIAEKQMHLLVTKPIHRFQIWFGKWFALLAINATLLIVAGAVTYGTLIWTTNHSEMSALERKELNEQILIARANVAPNPNFTSQDVEEVIQKARESGQIDPSDSLEKATQKARRSIQLANNTLKPGIAREWVFDLPSAWEQNDQPYFLRYKVAAERLYVRQASGVWRTEGKDSFEKKVDLAINREEVLRVPPEAVKNGKLKLSFENLPENDVTLLFSLKSPPSLMVYSGSFEMNYIRSLLTMFCQLALMSAIGVSMGSLFTMPVAIFSSMWVLILMGSSRFLQQLATGEAFSGGCAHCHTPSEAPLSGVGELWHSLTHQYYYLLSQFVRPLKGLNPLESLASGELVSWSFVGNAFLIKGLLYCSLVAIVGIVVFKRKEIAGLH